MVEFSPWNLPASTDKDISAGALFGNVILRGNALADETSAGKAGVDPRSQAIGQPGKFFLSVTFFPTVAVVDGSATVFPYAVLFTNIAHNSGYLNRVIDHVPQLMQLEDSGGQQGPGKVYVDTTYLNNRDSVMSVLAALKATDADGYADTTFLYFIPMMTSAQRQTLVAKTGGWKNLAINGSSLGMATFAAVCMFPPVFYTGYVRFAPPALRVATRSDQLRQDAANAPYYTALVAPDFVDTVQYIGIKAAWADAVGVPLIVPYKSEYGAPLWQMIQQHVQASGQTAAMVRRVRKFQSTQTGMNLAPYSMAKLLAGKPWLAQAPFSMIAVAVTAAEALLLGGRMYLSMQTKRQALLVKLGASQPQFDGAYAVVAAQMEADRARSAEQRHAMQVERDAALLRLGAPPKPVKGTSKAERERIAQERRAVANKIHEAAAKAAEAATVARAQARAGAAARKKIANLARTAAEKRTTEVLKNAKRTFIERHGAVKGTVLGLGQEGPRMATAGRGGGGGLVPNTGAAAAAARAAAGGDAAENVPRISTYATNGADADGGAPTQHRSGMFGAVKDRLGWG